MSLTVFRQSLRQSARTLAILAAAAGLFFYLVLLSSSSFATHPQDSRFLQNPPKAIGAFLGGSVDFFHPSGWLAAAMNHPISLALFIGAAFSIAAGAVAAEIERGTIDLVLSRPVGRLRFLGAKAAAAAAAVALVEAGGMLGVVIARVTIRAVAPLTIGQIARAFGVSWVLFAAFAMVGTLVSARSSLRSRANGIGIGVLVGWFFMNFVALLFDGVSGMRFASPFHYFRPGDVIAGKPLVLDVVALGVLGAVALAAALWSFARRDLTR